MNTQRDPVFGCMRFVGRLDADGYGRIGRRKAHIVAWEAAFGVVPEGFELDHVCRRRNCCAVAHLAAVTRAENLKRREWRYRVKMKLCARGHSLEGALVTPEGGRLCRTCHQGETR